MIDQEKRWILYRHHRKFQQCCNDRLNLQINLPIFTCFTACSLNLIVCPCFGILFIIFLSIVTLIVRHSRKTISRGKLITNDNGSSSPAAQWLQWWTVTNDFPITIHLSMGEQVLLMAIAGLEMTHVAFPKIRFQLSAILTNCPSRCSKSDGLLEEHGKNHRSVFKFPIIP